MSRRTRNKARRVKARPQRSSKRGTQSPKAPPAQSRVPRRRLAALLLLAGAAAALVWLWPGGALPALVERTADQNVLLVTIDTLRADALGSYGGPATTPNLDRLVAAGARFEFAHAHAVVTLPSHASILTGVYPFEHGIHDNAGYRLPEDSLTLAAMLRAEGFATGAFVGAFPLDSRFGLDNGFDLYDDRFGYAEGPSDFTIAERPAEEVVAAARAWIESRPDRWFAWVHLFDPHAVYSPPPPFDARYAESPYHGEVLMHPLILQHQITPKTSRYTRCSMSMLPNVSINGRIRSSGQLGRWWYSISPCRNSECVRRFTVFAFNQRS